MVFAVLLLFLRMKSADDWKGRSSCHMTFVNKARGRKLQKCIEIGLWRTKVLESGKQMRPVRGAQSQKFVNWAYYKALQIGAYFSHISGKGPLAILRRAKAIVFRAKK